jgi:hypothetical protein
MIELPRYPDQLRGKRALFIELGERDDMRFILPLAFGEMEGVQWRRVKPGGDLERPTLPIPWIVLIDDRAPGASGPGGFDPGTLQWLFADAFKIAIDAAEPHEGIYEYLVEEGLKRQRILIIQTVESRRALWREFTREHCELYGVLELVSVFNNPDQYVLPSVIRFEGRTAPGE